MTDPKGKLSEEELDRVFEEWQVDNGCSVHLIEEYVALLQGDHTPEEAREAMRDLWRESET